MKRIILLSLFLITGVAIAATYEELLQNFKEELYAGQALTKNKEKYFAFITPVIQ